MDSVAGMAIDHGWSRDLEFVTDGDTHWSLGVDLDMCGRWSRLISDGECNFGASICVQR